ncbi:MAG TPA: hypothetical protein VLH08_04960 [Acidobacteriota bacterium]|nr:hypothetical protein [Acidobacteriota bacterium]
MIEDIRYSKKINWPLFIAFIVLMVVLLVYFDKAIAQDNKDPKAVQIAQESIQAMGGIENWKNTAAIRFNFVVAPEGQESRAVKHLWDRKNNRDHVEGKTREGKMQVVWVNLSDKSGVAWEDGQKLDGEKAKKALDWAYSRWINDTYWLIMPLKLMDKGVNLKYDGEKNGRDVLHLSFNKVGETPGDQYWAHISKSTRLMEHWNFELESKDKGSFDWIDWQPIGNMKFSKVKESEDKKLRIKFEPLEAQNSADAAFFGQELKQLD